MDEVVVGPTMQRTADVVQAHVETHPPRVVGVGQADEPRAGADSGAEQRREVRVTADHRVEGDDVYRGQPVGQLHGIAIAVLHSAGQPPSFGFRARHREVVLRCVDVDGPGGALFQEGEMDHPHAGPDIEHRRALHALRPDHIDELLRRGMRAVPLPPRQIVSGMLAVVTDQLQVLLAAEAAWLTPIHASEYAVPASRGSSEPGRRPASARGARGHPLRAGGRCEALVVRDKCAEALTKPNRRGKVDGVEGPQGSRREGRRRLEHVAVQLEQLESREQLLRGGSRGGRSPGDGPPELDGGDSAGHPGSRRVQVCPERFSLVLGDQQLHQSGRIEVDPLGYEGSSSRISRNTSESCLPGSLGSAGGSELQGFRAGVTLPPASRR